MYSLISQFISAKLQSFTEFAHLDRSSQIGKKRKDGRSTCFRPCDRFSSSRQASGCHFILLVSLVILEIYPGWLWLPLLLLHLPGAEGAEHVHHLVRQHLRLPLRLQRADPLPVHILRLANSLVRKKVFRTKMFLNVITQVRHSR